MKVLTASQMREVDRLTTARYGLPSFALMENAGNGVVSAMELHWGHLRDKRVVVCCGKGNNGGDGFVAARQLLVRGVDARILLFAPWDEVKGDARANLDILGRMQASIQVVEMRGCSEEALRNLFQDLSPDIVVDALLGTGARLPVEGFLAAVIRELARFPRIVAIDIPSGMDCDATNASAATLAPKAELTVTFTAPKPVHVFSGSDGGTGKWMVIPIGSPPELIEKPEHWLNFFVIDEAADTLGNFQRRDDSHKGDYGHVAVVAGSLGKTGAACMTARSALLAGAGLVTVATPAPCLPIIASQMLEVMTEPLEATEAGTVSTKAFDYGRVETLVEGKDVLAIGPGLGRHAETTEFVRRLVSGTRMPVVLDADGIHAFVGSVEGLNGRERILILTPHPGEFARLLGQSIAAVQADRVGLARKFALDQHAHVVLKGYRTIYASSSGQVFVNSTGNPGMATGGTGDVLTGILAGLLGQAMHRPAFAEDATTGFVEQVVALGIFLHGLAGDLAANDQGEISLVASDLMAKLPAAFAKVEQSAISSRAGLDARGLAAPARPVKGRQTSNPIGRLAADC